MSCCNEEKTCKTCQYYSTSNISVICRKCKDSDPKRVYVHWQPKIASRYIYRSKLKTGTIYVAAGPNNSRISVVFLRHTLQSGLLVLLKGEFVVVGSENQPIVTELTYENWRFSLLG